jgi:hypothetical protein
MKRQFDVTLPGSAQGVTVRVKRFLKSDPAILTASIVLQLILGALFGHIYDMRIFMATGYLVGTGQNPYIPQDLSAVFQNPAFQNITTIGYPPPWALILGLIYRMTYAIVPNFLVYNLAIKLPVIIANIALAYLVRTIIVKINPETGNARRAWIFMLLNPFLLCATAAWGQFDAIVAFLALASLYLLDSGKYKLSSILLALAIAFKPIALPLILIPLFYLKPKPPGQAIRYYGILVLSGLLFCVAPFVIFGWDSTPILENWNAHFLVGGGLSFMVFLEYLRNTYQIPRAWEILGASWVPALGLAAFFLNRGMADLRNLLLKSAALIMVFFLTRTWLSEPNLVLILPFLVILTSIHELDGFTLAAIWILPLIFAVFNTALAQLFFPSMPAVMEKLLAVGEEFRTFRLMAKIIVVIPWQFAGWWVVIRCFRAGLAATPKYANETKLA